VTQSLFSLVRVTRLNQSCGALQFRRDVVGVSG